VLNPPPLRLQPAEHPSDLTLGPSADTAASGHPSPATSVHRQSHHHDQQQSGQRRCSGAGGGYRQRTGGDRGRASCSCAAQTPSLLAARKVRPEHPNKLAAASDTLLAASSPGSTCSCDSRPSQFRWWIPVRAAWRRVRTLLLGARSTTRANGDEMRVRTRRRFGLVVAWRGVRSVALLRRRGHGDVAAAGRSDRRSGGSRDLDRVPARFLAQGLRWIVEGLLCWLLPIAAHGEARRTHRAVTFKSQPSLARRRPPRSISRARRATWLRRRQQALPAGQLPTYAHAGLLRVARARVLGVWSHPRHRCSNPYRRR
jgi:hypothetical protein